MPKARPITAAGRRRVDEGLEERGMLLVQGQAELPSVGDLLAGRPITTQGYSYDHVPAWIHARTLTARDDVAEIKLLRGRRTLVLRRLWPAVQALAVRARAALIAGGERTESHAASDRRRLLERIEARPGLSGDDLKRDLGLDARAFQRAKNDLCARLALWPEDQDESADLGHTHDQLWSPWARGKIARGTRSSALPSPDSAMSILLAPLILPPKRPPAPATLFPALAPC
jgi:hypothetical protein